MVLTKVVLLLAMVLSLPLMAENIFRSNLLLKCEGQGITPQARLVITASSYPEGEGFRTGVGYLVATPNSMPQTFEDVSILGKARGYKLYDTSAPTTEDRLMIALSQTGSQNAVLEYKKGRQVQLNLFSTDFLADGNLKAKIPFQAKLHIGTPLTDAASLGFTQRQPLDLEIQKGKNTPQDFQFLCEVQTF